jgi:prephenate dehydrogenase/chorismate mutase
MASDKPTDSIDSVDHWSKLFEQHRRDIQAIDRRILHLTCERLELAKQIGQLKMQQGIPVRNFKVEAIVRRRFAEACEFLGLDPHLGDDLAMFLISKAVEQQAMFMDSVYQGDYLSALIIGGKGGMGKWIASFLRGQGHRVEILDPSPGETPFTEAESLADGVQKADLIVVAVPMTVCAKVLEEVAELRPKGVVAELCSLKSHLLPVMNRLREDGMRLVSFHPLFGPGVKTLSGRTIVLCTEGDPDDRAVVRGLFEETTVEFVEIDIPEHDRRMGLVLGLTHLSNLVFARALLHSGVTAHEIAEVAGSTYAKQIKTTREVTEENPGLYFEIQALNSITPETTEWLKRAVDEYAECITNNDGDAFSKIMVECREHLANHSSAEAGSLE